MKNILVKALIVVVILVKPAYLKAASWEDWELGGELGFSYGTGGTVGRILSPALRVTMTRQLEDKFLELGIGYIYGSEIIENYTEEDAEFHTQELIDDAGNDVKARLSVVPITANFFYKFYESFYIGAGAGFYNVFYKEEPLGEWRVDPDEDQVPGEIVKAPSSTALGFQQIVGMEIFPMSDKWSWFIGLKTFFTTSAPRVGGLVGFTLGGKVRYSW